jgi:hypothetical protein
MASPHVAALAGLLWSQNPSVTAQGVVDRIHTTASPISGTGTYWAWGRIDAAAALAGWGLGPATLTLTPTQTNTPTATPTQTNTPTATPTNTAIPTPTRVTCPSPRPPVQIASAANGSGALNVTITAGAGVIREIDFRSMPNAAVTVGNQSNKTEPFVYGPPSNSSSVPFTVTQQSGSQAATVNLAILDDCGGWTTFVGGGPNVFLPLPDIQVALTWGAGPADLDVHLSGPSTSGGRFHTYWNSPTVVTHAGISADDHDGFGPESVTIRRNTATGTWVPGEYRIWAHNYSVTPDFSGSSARFTVTRAAP